MVKLKHLNGIAYNLIDSMLSPMNLHFLGLLKQKLIENEEEKLNLVIKLLSEEVNPKNLENEDIKYIIEKYKKIFYDELEKFEIPKDLVSGVLIKISVNVAKKPVNSFAGIESKRFGKLKGIVYRGDIEISGKKKIERSVEKGFLI